MLVLWIIAAGMLAGRLLTSQRRTLVIASRGATWSLYLLIFLLGLSVGSDGSVLGALGQLGLQAIILCLGGILGSLLISAIVYTRCFAVAPREE
jgi:uncharacterized membrane protein YbjE (DUF340 family)